MLSKLNKLRQLPLQWQFTLQALIAGYAIIVLILTGIYLSQRSPELAAQHVFSNWYENTVIKPISQRMSLSSEKMSIRAVDSVMTQLTELTHEITDFGVVKIHNFVLVDKAGMLQKQWGQAAFNEGDITSQLPMFVRDDLADSLMGHFNSGIERQEQKAWIVRSIYNEKQQIVAALVSVQSWQSNPVGKLSKPIWQFLPWMDILLLPVLPIVFVLCVIVVAVQLVRYRLQPELAELERILESWSQGKLSNRLDTDKPIEIANCYKRLNHLAEDLQHYIGLKSKQEDLQTRCELAVGLHDTVKQSLFANKMLLATLAHQLKQSSAGSLFDIVAQIERTNQQVMVQITELITSFSTKSDDLIQVTDLTQSLRRITSQFQLEAELQVNLIHKVHYKVANVIQQVVAEAMQNTYKHSDVKRVSITCEQSQDGHSIALRVRDFGRSATFHSGQGIRLMCMQVEQLGGQFEIITSHEDDTPGVLVCVLLPNQEIKE